MASEEADTKRERLVGLESRMKEHFAQKFPQSQLWFFEDNSGAVAGYLGTDPVMFVGQRPSTGGGAARQALGGFYGLLREYGFTNAHVTDLVKERMKVGIPSGEQVDRNWPFFQEELKIIRPKVLVALGGWVYWTLEHRVEFLVPIERIMHYSYRFIRSPERENRLREDLARIRGKVDATPGNCCREDDH